MDISELSEVGKEFERLVQIMNDLREKCPWDKKQTIESLRSQTVEETYELADAILNKDWNNIKEELGDLLLHIVFYAKISNENNRFTLQDVINGICEKLITRHPHIYGNVIVQDDNDVKRNWEQIKLKEGKTSVLSGVPSTLPAVSKAQLIQGKAKQVGFEWDNTNDVYKKVEEELAELQEAILNNNMANMEEEFGDVMFSLINYARFIKVDAEAALERTNKKFIYRFQLMETMATTKGLLLQNMSLTEMDALWNDIKQQKTNA